MGNLKAVRVERSLKRSGRSFSTLDDFAKSLREDGLLAADDELDNHPEFFPAIFEAWIRGAQLGCLFAVDFANRQDVDLKGHWQQLVVNDEPDGPTLHRRLNDLLVAPQPPHAVSILFPRVKDGEGVATLVATLCKDQRWGWEEIKTDDKTLLLVGLRWRLPAESSVSWPLGFSPIPTMPFTRRAPWTAIMLRTRQSGREPPPGLLDFVHLADLPPYAAPEKNRSDLWEKTAEYKVDLLPKDAERANAKAKITFTLPGDCRRLLPEPTSYKWAPQDSK